MARRQADALLMCSLAALAAAVPAAAQPAVATYREACDGSAAVALDDRHFAVADDDSNVLRVYRTGESKPAETLHLNGFLQAPPKKSKGFKEADLEGAARVGDRIYWIGSHGRDSDGDAEPGRARFFATRIVGPSNAPRLEPVGSQAYQGLRDALLAAPQLAPLQLRQAYAPDKKKGGPKPEDDNGFNIEGLAAAPDGSLLIGFRNPRPNDRAILVPLTNPAAVVEKGATPVFGKPVQLNLGGRGIRSIDRVGERYLIVAGPHGTPDKSAIRPPFAIFTWSGADGADPVMVPSVPMPADFIPEALFASPDESRMTLLSDDGTDACKKAPQSRKTFRALTVPLPK